MSKWGRPNPTPCQKYITNVQNIYLQWVQLGLERSYEMKLTPPKETNMKYRIRHAILDAIGLLAVGIVCFGIPTLFFVAIQ